VSAPGDGGRTPLDPLREFLHDEAAGGLVLIAASIVALVCANSPIGDDYARLWERHLDIGLDLDLHHWVNDGLMALFFFVVGLEIKRELVTGELRDRRAATLPALAALAGVALPVALYALIAGGGEAGQGWAIPAATDIAFAVGVLAVLGDRIPAGVRLLLLTIAIVDDILAIAIIAIFYAGSISTGWLLAAAGVLALVVALRVAGVASIAVYAVAGVALWVCAHESGIHATIAGVLLGLLCPARPVRGRPVLEQLEHRIHPISAFAIIPLFALANAGVDLRGGVLGDALGSAVCWAVVVGLVVGKFGGIWLATRAALALGAGTLPEGVAPRHVPGVAALGGIGFTVSLFIASLAFDDPALEAAAKVGILLGSILAGTLGAALLLATRRG
jgi:NhaA family Na+:H+ antiporter